MPFPMTIPEPKKKGGRPRVPEGEKRRKEYFTLSPVTMTLVRKVAKSKQISKSALVEQALLEMINKEAH